MGVISKQIRKRANQRLAAPLTTTTTLTPADVRQAVQRVCDTYNRQASAQLAKRRTEGNKLKRWAAGGENERRLHFYVVLQEQDVLVSYEQPPQYILANRQKPGWTSGYWLAVVRFPKPATPLPPGHWQVELCLLKWVTDRDGKLESKDKYEVFSNALWETLCVPA